MKLTMAGYVGILSLSIFLTGCSQGPLSMQWGSSKNNPVGGLSSELDNSYTAQAISIIQNNCTQCHGNSSGPSNIYGLTDLGHLTATGLVVPGDPGHSTLYNVISSGSMPPSGPLSNSDQTIIENWISTALPPTASPTPSPTSTPVPTPSPTPSVNASTFTTLKSQIFSPKCIGCHSGTGASAGIRFDTYTGLMATVNTASPSSSLVYTVTSSGAMPPAASKRLTSAQEAMILEWIQAGAKNN